MTFSAPPLSVSQLVALLQETIEDNFMQVLVEGEISNLSRPASGHLYLTLKDAQAQIRGVMFRGASRLLKFRPEDGQQVLCRGRMTVYRQRGDMQFMIDSLEAVGSGSLQVAFDQLKEKLANEGLFASERKRELPVFPKTVGIVTSGSGAALHDMLKVFQKDSAGFRVIVAPVRVQGESAAREIVEAIEDLNVHGEAEVLIVGRGGGSLEDLWPFNEEIVARTIVASRMPIISAVGHEVDVTISDYVSDYRAATPTAAAEYLLRTRLNLEAHLDQVRFRLATQMTGRLYQLREKVVSLRHRLISPAMQLALWQQRLQDSCLRLQRTIGHDLQRRRDLLAALAGKLNTLSPLQTLQRGYAIVQRERDGSTISDAAELQQNERLQLHFANGGAAVRVEEVIS